MIDPKHKRLYREFIKYTESLFHSTDRLYKNVENKLQATVSSYK